MTSPERMLGEWPPERRGRASCRLPQRPVATRWLRNQAGKGEGPDFPFFVSQCWCPHMGQVQSQPLWAQSRMEGTGDASGGPGQRDAPPAPGRNSFYCQLPALCGRSTQCPRSTQQDLVHYTSHPSGLGKWVTHTQNAHPL